MRLSFVPALLLSLSLFLVPAQPAAAASNVVLNMCTDAALRSAVATAETTSISFNCGTATITLASPLDITKPSLTIDGGGTITLAGAGNNRLITHHTYGNIGSSTLTLKNLTIINGRISGGNEAANGGAIASYFEAANPAYKPTLIIDHVTFHDNQSTVTSVSGGLSSSDFGGGAIYSRGGAVQVSASIFDGNKANNGAGGAIHILQSGLTIDGSTFSANTAIGASAGNSSGGAIYIDGLGGENSRFTLTNSIFSDNQTYNTGGAIYVNMYENSSTLSIDQTRFTSNAVIGGSRAQGGAIGGGGTTSGANTGNPTITISRSLFQSNTAKRSGAPADGSGGALSFPQRAILRIENSTFNGNRAEGTSYNANGGALYVVNNTTPFEVTSSTFANNYAGWVGGAISNSQISGQPGGIVRQTIFSNNTAGGIANFQQHCSSELREDGPNLQYPPRLTNANYYNDVTCFKGKSDPSQTSLPAFRDPQLQPLADNGGATHTMAIAATSPAFDAADSCLATDQRGISRPQGAKCDLGAFELVQQLSVSSSLISQNDSTFTLTVNGSGFTAASQIVINGTPHTTAFISATTLATQLAGSDFPSVGAFDVTVSNSSLPPAKLIVVAQLERIFAPLATR